MPHISFASAVTRDVGSAASPGVPVFVLKTGAVLSLGNYQYQDGRITYTLANGGGGVVSTDDIDWTTTTRMNTQRGVNMPLHGGHINGWVAGM